VSTARDAARRVQCKNNLHQIGMAMQSYHEQHGCFPPAYVADENGMPMHSWRVLLLPFLDHEWLYQQYDLSQPWDSPANKMLAIHMPSVYGCPSDSNAEFQETSYMVIVGPGTLFDGDENARVSDVLDGGSNTIMVVEAIGSSVSWMEPVDLHARQMTFAIDSGWTGEISSAHHGGAHVLLVDGSVQFLDDSTSPEQIEAMTTIRGGESISQDY